MTNLESTTETLEQKLSRLTAKLGNLLHDEWRAPRKKEDGTYDPRIKVLIKMEDGKEKWFNEGDSNITTDSQEIKRQDIANTSFDELDSKWQEDNKLAAEVAMGEVFKAIESGRALDDQSFIESASAVVHEEWLKRNGWQATEIQKKPYEELPEEEKRKDRVQIIKAINIFNS